MSLVLGLGLEHSCPWPREGLSSERLSLALPRIFFVSLALASSLVSSTPPLLKKLDNPLWYLSERLVVLSFFSDKLSVQEKQAKATALLRYEQKDVSFSNELLLLEASETTQLKDLVGVDSW